MKTILLRNSGKDSGFAGYKALQQGIQIEYLLIFTSAETNRSLSKLMGKITS